MQGLIICLDFAFDNPNNLAIEGLKQHPPSGCKLAS